MEDHFMSISPSFTSAHVDLNLNEKSLYQDVKSLSVTTEYTTVSSTEYFHNSLFVDATTISNVYSAVGKTERIRTVSDKISSNEDKNTSKRKRLRADIMNKLKNITTLSDRRKKVKIKTPRSNKQKKQKQKETKKVNALISSASQQTTTVQPNTTKNGAKIDTGFESKIKTETETNKLPEETNPIHKDSQREKKPVQTEDGLNNDTGINSEGKTYNGSKSQDKPNSKDKLENGISKMDSFDDVTPVSGHDDQYLDNNDTEQGTRKESSEYPNYSYHNDPDFINGNDTLISAVDFICESKDFIGAQGKRCCQKSIKCFGDLPQLIDEIETYNNSEDQDDLQRQHVCQHIKNSMLCMGHAMALPVCKSSVTFVHRKLNDTLSDVTQFHTESCQTGSSPPPIIPTTATTSVTSSSGGIGNHRGIGNHTHEHTNYAAIIGGVAGGAILIFLIILILLLLRKNKSKRPSEFSGKDSDGGMTLSNGSSRYKTHIGLSRKQSEVYAEIDESSMHSNQSFSDKRPLPSAPSNGPVSSDNTGYLTPRSSKDELGLINDRDSGGYHVLQKEPSRKPSVDAYEKLQNEEGEYIEPTHTRDSRVRIPSQKAPENNTSNISKPNGDDNYHMYFVLEKENAVHV